MRSLLLVMMCSTLCLGACKGWQPNAEGTDVTGPAGQSLTATAENLGTSIFGDEAKPIISSAVATLIAIWAWKKRKALVSAVKSPSA